MPGVEIVQSLHNRANVEPGAQLQMAVLARVSHFSPGSRGVQSVLAVQQSPEIPALAALQHQLQARPVLQHQLYCQPAATAVHCTCTALYSDTMNLQSNRLCSSLSARL